MKMKNHITGILALCLAFMAGSLNAQERVYVSTDKNSYLAGELDIIEELEAPRLADTGGAELSMDGSTPDDKRGTLANAYIWNEIYSKSLK